MSWLVTVIIVNTLVGWSTVSSAPSSDQSKDFAAEKKVRNGYKEVIARLDGSIALQRTAAHGNDTLRLHEITDGSTIVQLVFSPFSQLVDCDVSNSEHQIHRLTKHVNSKHAKTEKYLSLDLQFDEMVSLTNLAEWSKICNKLQTSNLKTGNIKTDSSKESSSKNAVAKDYSSSAVKGSPPDTRSKRGIMDLIYPGTKWCGKGNSADHYDDLGEMQESDMCCREHDMCQENIPALSTSYNYFNFGLLTLSSCRCDRRFKRCLEMAARRHKDPVADLIGHLYFNVIGMKCFILEYQDYCTESSWWGRCLRREKRLAASFNTVLLY